MPASLLKDSQWQRIELLLPKLRSGCCHPVVQQLLGYMRLEATVICAEASIRRQREVHGAT